MKSSFKKTTAITVLATALLCLFTGCLPDISVVFGTTFELVSEGGNNALKKKMLEELDGLEAVFSSQTEGSDIYKINAAAAGQSVAVDQRTVGLLTVSKQLYLKSDKAYNPAVYGLVELWQFSPDTYTGIASAFTPPSAEAVAQGLALADFDKVTVDAAAGTVTKLDGKIKIDLGAIAKGYAVGVLAELAGERDADVLINLGGNLYAVGDKEYTVGIAHPRYGESTANYFAKLKLKNNSVSTSGDYERCYIKEGVRYHHIIDRSGSPAKNGIISVTAIGKEAALCDAVTTAVLVLGIEEGSALIREYNLSAVIITDRKTYSLINMDSFDFELTDGEYTLE